MCLFIFCVLLVFIETSSVYLLFLCWLYIIYNPSYSLLWLFKDYSLSLDYSSLTVICWSMVFCALILFKRYLNQWLANFGFWKILVIISPIFFLLCSLPAIPHTFLICAVYSFLYFSPFIFSLCLNLDPAPSLYNLFFKTIFLEQF